MLCPYDPETGPLSTQGMHHCPECGLMVVGGCPHPEVRRLAPRRRREDAYLDVTDRPDLWTDADGFDYADDL
jgi:hypothetical protein